MLSETKLGRLTSYPKSDDARFRFNAVDVVSTGSVIDLRIPEHDTARGQIPETALHLPAACETIF